MANSIMVSMGARTAWELAARPAATTPRPARLACDWDVDRKIVATLPELGIDVVSSSEGGNFAEWVDRCAAAGANVVATMRVNEQGISLPRVVLKAQFPKNQVEQLLSNLRKMGFVPGDSALALGPPPPPPKPERDAYDLERSCTSKKRYGDEKQANRIVAKVREQRGVELRAYPCFDCGGYHVTHLLRVPRTP